MGTQHLGPEAVQAVLEFLQRLMTVERSPEPPGAPMALGMTTAKPRRLAFRTQAALPVNTLLKLALHLLTEPAQPAQTDIFYYRKCVEV